MNHKVRAGVENEVAKVKLDRKELVDEKARSDKRVALQTTEVRSRMRTELEQLITQFDESCWKHRKELEDNKRMAVLESEKEEI